VFAALKIIIMNNKVIIIKGNKGDGKTTKLKNIVNLLKTANVGVAGFVAVGEWQNGKRSKYTLVDILTFKMSVICTVTATDGYQKHGRFYFNPNTIEFGENVLANIPTKKNVVVIDEIGPFELDGEVWHNSLQSLLNNTNHVLLISVRNKLIDEVINKYKLKNMLVFDVKSSDNEIIKKIEEFLI